MGKSGITFEKAAIELKPQLSGPPGMDGLDELAAELGVAPGGDNTLSLQGKGGEWYDWIAILAAHVKEMRRSRG